MKTLSLVIPVYNEENTLENIVYKTLEIENEQFFIDNNIKLELILVDDFSKDNSKTIANSLEKKDKRIKVFSHTKNQGKGAALKTGFKNANGDFIGIQDADMEYNPKDYIKLLKLMFEKEADIVYGSRYLKQDNRRVLYFWHTFMNKMLTLFSNMYTNLDITDMETCYKLFRANVIKNVLPDLKENRFGFEPEVTIKSSKKGYKIYECAVSYNPRSYEEGKKIGAKDGIRALYCIMHYGGSSAPLPMQFILYSFIGGISAVVNIVSFLIFIKFGGLFFSISLAFILSALVNYILCITLLFKHKARWSSFGEVLTYIITLIIMGSADYFITYLFLNTGMGNFLAKSISNLLGLIGNFLLRKYLVFPEKK